MTFDFTPTEQPTVSRTAEPNPFTDAVQSLVAKRKADPSDNSALSFTVEKPHGPDRDALLEKSGRQLAKAGAAAGVTVRKAIRLEPKYATMTFWVRDRITRQAITDATPANVPQT